MYGASVFKLSILDENQYCFGEKRLLFASKSDTTFSLYCSIDVFQQTATSHILAADEDAMIIPSATANVLNDFETSIRVNYDIEHFKQATEDICNIERFPNVHLCNSKIQEDQSLIVRRSMEMRKFMNCSFELQRITDSYYFIKAVDYRDGKCSLWTADNIGQTLVILGIKASCWIYWLAGDTTAMGNCSKYDTISEKINVLPRLAILIDSRGDESCETRSISLLKTNVSRVYEINTDEFAMKISKAPSYLRIHTSIGRLSVMQDKKYLTLIGNASINATAYNYTCIIGKANTDTNGIQPGEKPVCRFDIKFMGLKSTTIFLDANDQTEFNVGLKTLSGIHGPPYMGEIPPLVIQPIEPSHVTLQIKSYLRLSPMYIRVLIMQKPYTNGTSLLHVYTATQPANCEESLKKITIHGTCPPGKHLSLEYPLSFDKQTWLYGNPIDHDDFARIATLPYNYQPPSHLGKAIPLTPNIYNADPSKPMHRQSYKITRDISRFKQCQGKLSR